ncbi:hypothetical protein Gbfr_021_228 [Gluconobacter frateurii M-2]|nr:hypothetical protein Gbfr_021_228 [Gluconobacter frateurii M-2]
MSLTTWVETHQQGQAHAIQRTQSAQKPDRKGCNNVSHHTRRQWHDHETSAITNEAADELELAVGKEAYAVIKASSVMIGVD